MALQAFLEKQKKPTPKKNEEKKTPADEDSDIAETVFACSGFRGNTDITLTDQLLFKVYNQHFAEALKRNSSRLRIKEAQKEKGEFLFIFTPALRTQDCASFTSKLEEEWETVQKRDGRTIRQQREAALFGESLKRRKLDQASGGEIARAISAATTSGSSTMSQILAELVRQNKIGENADGLEISKSSSD